MEGRHSPQYAPSEPAAEQTPPRKPRKKRKSVFRLIVQDILLTGLVLCVFALFHHVIPRLTAANREMPTPVSIQTPAPVQTLEPQQTPAPTETENPEATPEPTPEPTPDPMDWRTKFAEHFTDEIVVTENSYTSPNIAIHIDTYTTDDPAPTTYFVADIYIAQLENFQTYWAGGKLSYYMYESPLSIAKNAEAILSINGDYADNQLYGFLVRNGELYYTEQTTNDICVLYYDGTMETYDADEYKVEDVLARSPYQVWKFGPALLDGNGQPKERSAYNTTTEIGWENPRSGVGYYEPGHYCFVIVDGRQSGYSRGLEIERFAQVFADLGCVCAYNLDGGQSAVMTFNQGLYSHPYLGGRDSGDILLIRELPTAETGEEGEG